MKTDKAWDEAEDLSCTVFLVKIPSTATWPVIKQVFTQYGTLDMDASMFVPSENKAILTFAAPESVTKAKTYTGNLGVILAPSVDNFNPETHLRIFVCGLPVGCSEQEIFQGIGLSPEHLQYIQFKWTRDPSKGFGILTCFNSVLYSALLQKQSFQVRNQPVLLQKSFYSKESASLIRLWLGYLPHNASVKKLTALLCVMKIKFLSLSLPRDENNASKGYAFVNFINAEDAVNAIHTVVPLKNRKVCFAPVHHQKQQEKYEEEKEGEKEEEF